MNTKRVFYLLIFLAAMLGIVLTSHQIYAQRNQSLDTKSADLGPQADRHASIYFAEAGDLKLPESEITQGNIEVVTTQQELANHVAANPRIAIIYFGARALDEVNADWLQEQHQHGKVIVAINVPIRVLC